MTKVTRENTINILLAEYEALQEERKIRISASSVSVSFISLVVTVLIAAFAALELVRQASSCPGPIHCSD